MADSSCRSRGQRARALRRPPSGASQQALLACGILSSLLYVATDILGGLRYEGYSFTSQAISELMAVRAPSEAFVDPLLIAYSAAGFTGPTLFEMHPRGTAGVFS